MTPRSGWKYSIKIERLGDLALPKRQENERYVIGTEVEL